jgi:MFS family permease
MVRFSREEIGGAGLAWAGAAAFMAALFIALAPAQIFDDRLFNGAPIWDKPLKFAISLSLHFLTLAALVQILPRDRRGGMAIGFAVLTSIASGVFEILYIAFQAMRGRASHYNYETALETSIYALMGVGAVLLVLAAFILGLRIAMSRGEPASGLRDGAILGLLFGPLLTLIVAGYMSQNGSHFANAPLASDQDGIFLFGWSTTDPDLRPAHFFALHMMQAAPLAGWLGDRINPRAGSAFAFVAAAIFGMLSIAAFAIALSGQSPQWFLS